MRCFIVLILVFLLILPAAVTVYAEPIDSRLARMEEKIDFMVEKMQDQKADYDKLDVRLINVEQKQEKHSSTFAVLGWIGGAAWGVILLLITAVFRRWFEKKPVPSCEGG